MPRLYDRLVAEGDFPTQKYNETERSLITSKWTRATYRDEGAGPAVTWALAVRHGQNKIQGESHESNKQQR